MPPWQPAARVDASAASFVVTCGACAPFRALRNSRAAALEAAQAHCAAFHPHAAADAASRRRRRGLKT